MLFFRDVIGHRKIIDGLKSTITSGRVAHAYLFWGPEGTGKRTVALAFAAALLCSGREKGSDADACGQCKECRQIAGGNHPDLHFIEPRGASIKIEQVRDVQKKAVYKSYQGKYRFYLIDPADVMTLQAANCLLRILEEPPENTIFVLVSSNPYALLPTVLSRCQQVQFKALSPKEVKEGLQREAFDNLLEERLKFLSVMAGGSLGKAISLAQDKSMWEEREEVLKTASRLRGATPSQAFALAETWALDKETALRRLEILLYWYRDLLLWKETGRRELLASRDLLNYAVKQSYLCSGLELVKMIEETEKTLKQLKRNVITRLALEMLFLRLAGGGENNVTSSSGSTF